MSEGVTGAFADGDDECGAAIIAFERWTRVGIFGVCRTNMLYDTRQDSSRGTKMDRPALR